MKTITKRTTANNSIEPAVFNLEGLMEYLQLGKDRADLFGRQAGARIHLSEKRIGYLKNKIDEELERRA